MSPELVIDALAIAIVQEEVKRSLMRTLEITESIDRREHCAVATKQVKLRPGLSILWM